MQHSNVMDKELQSITDCPQKLSTHVVTFFWTHSPFVVLFSSLTSNAIVYCDVIFNGSCGKIRIINGGQL